QAEDGIRDPLVTGVQTCALPIWRGPCPREVLRGVPREGARVRRSERRKGGRIREPPRDGERVHLPVLLRSEGPDQGVRPLKGGRSEERRVGTERSGECRREDERE